MPRHACRAERQPGLRTDADERGQPLLRAEVCTGDRKPVPLLLCRRRVQGLENSARGRPRLLRLVYSGQVVELDAEAMIVFVVRSGGLAVGAAERACAEAQLGVLKRGRQAPPPAHRSLQRVCTRQGSLRGRGAPPSPPLAA